MNEPKDYILLDWDGTLAKTLDVWLDTYKEVVNERGIEITDELDFVEKTFGKWEKGLENIGINDPVIAFKEVLEKGEKKMLQVELYPNAELVLKELKKKDKKLAIITSSYRHLIEPTLKKYAFKDYFDLVITKDETEVGKPDPWIVNTSLKYLSGTKEKALIIGDSDHDILTGHNSGICSVLFSPEHNTKFYRKEFLMKHNPDYVISDLIELVDIIN
jgi:pyrophosphatase PpaX